MEWLWCGCGVGVEWTTLEEVGAYVTYEPHTRGTIFQQGVNVKKSIFSGANW